VNYYLACICNRHFTRYLGVASKEIGDKGQRICPQTISYSLTKPKLFFVKQNVKIVKLSKVGELLFMSWLGVLWRLPTGKGQLVRLGKIKLGGRKSGLVIKKLYSRLEGCGFESYPMLEGNGVKAMPASITAHNHSIIEKKENIGGQMGRTKNILS
jgi:hypothetical protein